MLCYTCTLPFSQSQLQKHSNSFQMCSSEHQQYGIKRERERERVRIDYQILKECNSLENSLNKHECLQYAKF